MLTEEGKGIKAGKYIYIYIYLHIYLFIKKDMEARGSKNCPCCAPEF